MRPGADAPDSPAKIVRFQLDLLRIRLPRPLAISFHALRWQENFLVRLQDGDGLVGWGEGAPLKAITGDSLEEAIEEAGELEGATFPPLRSPEGFHSEFLGRLSSATLRAALDLAAHDMAARRRGIPVHRLYSGQARRVENSVTVFIQSDPEAGAREAVRLLEDHPHARVLKIKLKGSDDLERCRAIARVVPAGMRFILDANQGFADPSRAVSEIGRIVELLGEVILVEEPCRKRDLDAMAEVRRGLSGVKVFADESCADEADLERILEAGCADGINIKLQKAGGLVPAKRMAARAAQGGLEVMLGAMFETALSHSAGAHFAVSTPNVLLTDLDMDLDLPDFCRGRLPFADGARTPLDSPGFGFELDTEKLDRLAAEDVVSLRKVWDFGV